MIEAVNSTIAAATLTRALPEQVEAQRPVAVTPVQVAQRAAPTAPYVSPYISMNMVYDKAVLQLRNGDTGEVENQFPSENQLRAYQRAQAEARRTGEQVRRPTQAEVREIAPADVDAYEEVEAIKPAPVKQPQSAPTSTAAAEPAPAAPAPTSESTTTTFSTEV